MGKYIYTEKDGYDYISDTGLVYELLEGKSVFGESTSDIMFMIFSDKDAVFNGIEYVGFVYGATFMNDESFRNEVLETLNRYANDYEKEHPEVVEYYSKCYMFKEIQKTVRKYLIENNEILNESEIEKIKKQIEFLDEYY